MHKPAVQPCTPDGVVDFYFDFSSPYSYLAAERIDSLAGGYRHQVVWKPFLLGVTFRETGGVPLTERHPWQASYSREDFVRSARMAGIAYHPPTRFPQPSHIAARAFLWLQNTSPDLAHAFAREVFRELFVRDGEINAMHTLEVIAQSFEIDVDALRDGLADEQVRQHLHAATAEAEARQVFGAPMFFIGAERFWGFDRLGQLEIRLREKSGGKGSMTLVDQAMARVRTLGIDEAKRLHGQPDVVFVDLRDLRELERDGRIPGALHAPRGMLEFWVDPASPYHRKQFDPTRRFVLFCAAGWRSALATATLTDMAVLPDVAHIEGGFKAWRDSGGPVEAPPSSTEH